MGKPTGFLEYKRNAGGEKAPAERINNFNDFWIFSLFKFNYI